MGKKNKAFKLKEYKIPLEKYVVVVNPWGLPERMDSNTHLNEVGVWFQLLMKKDYPDARVREMFYQKTHRNIIVVLPQEIDVKKYLGAYKYSEFHNLIPQEDSRSVFIYEYRFSTFGNPAKTNWTGIVPSYVNIPTGLLQLLKDPFPFPSPAPLPPSDIAYARPIPQEIQNILATVRLITSTPEDKGKGKSTEVSPPSLPAPAPPPNVGSSCSPNQASTSTQSLFTPYEPPSHYRAHVEASKARSDQQEHVARELPQVKKIDPYEEEEMEKNLLRSLSPVKKEESNGAIDFLNSFLSTSEEKKPMIFPSKSISRTASTFDDEGDYKPSSELLEMFNTLPDELSSTARKDVVVKSEILDTVLPNDYKPSPELLELFSTLPDELSSTARKDVVVKSEILDTVLWNDRDPSSGDREDVIVKSEAIKTEMIGTVMPVPQARDRQRSMFPPSGYGNSQSSRDPRKRPMSSIIPIKNERNLETADEESGKRLKMNHR